VLVAYAALPTASSAFILAARMGAPSAPVAAVISFGTVAACFSLPLWLWLLSRFS
jgi:predicted permease